MHTDYSEDFFAQIKSQIETEIENNGAENLCAAFDADGTLWDIDVGEIVFDHQINQWDLDLPADPWKHYLDLKKENARAAYLWLAQILAGKSIDEVLEKNKEAYLSWEKDNGPLPIYSSQKKLIKFLQLKNIEVFVVTASVRWSVFYGASLYDIPSRNVIGVQSILDNNNKVTKEQKGFITYREGKAEAINSVKKNKKLILSSGNTMGDYELLKNSELIRLAVSSASDTEELFTTEQELKAKAKEANWLTHSFR